MVLTSVAIIVYFRRTSADTRLWHTRIAPVLGSIGLIAITALVIDNFTTLIGGSRVLADTFLAIIAIVFFGGVVVARTVNRRRAQHIKSLTSRP